MQEFLQIALSFPTAVFSALMVVMVLYWMLVILGALDLDVLDIELDLDMDGEVDIDLNLDVDADGMSGPGLIEATFAALGLGTVPVTIIASFWILLSWMISFAGVYYLAPVVGGLSTLVAVGFAVASFAASIPINMLLMQPFIHFFRPPDQRRGGDSLVGSMCEVTTGRVTDSFGQARVKDGGAGLVLSVRCDDGEALERGSEALIIDYDEERHAYLVEPLDALMGPGADRRSREVILAEQTAQAPTQAEPARAERAEQAISTSVDTQEG